MVKPQPGIGISPHGLLGFVCALTDTANSTANSTANTRADSFLMARSFLEDSKNGRMVTQVTH
jgi:hypothetical protein